MTNLRLAVDFEEKTNPVRIDDFMERSKENQQPRFQVKLLSLVSDVEVKSSSLSAKEEYSPAEFIGQKYERHLEYRSEYSKITDSRELEEDKYDIELYRGEDKKVEEDLDITEILNAED